MKKPRIFLSAENIRFEEQAEHFAKTYTRSEGDVSAWGENIIIRPDEEYQEIHGFGASFTDSAAIAMSAMPQDKLSDAMTKLFDKEDGIGLSLVRNCLGGSDFTPVYYTYDDMPEGEEDWKLEHFDFSHDMKQIIPLTKWAYEINPDILFFLSPWSAPLWMKDKPFWKSKEHPILRRECYEVYAKYMTKAIQCYEEQDLPIYAMTVQNEPFAHLNWPGMFMDEEALITLTNDYLRPTLTKAGLQTKILNLDYNTCYHPRGIKVMEATKDTTEGMAYHWYNGPADWTATSFDLYPDKLFYVSEASSDNPDTTAKLVHITTQIAKYLRMGMHGFIMWNIALDHNGGPTFENINTHCSGLLSCNTETKEITFTKDYYSLAHYSKFIRQGAKRVYATNTNSMNSKIVNFVAKNPDGSLTAVLVNGDGQDKICRFMIGDEITELTVPTNGVVTLHWDN